MGSSPSPGTKATRGPARSTPESSAAGLAQSPEASPTTRILALLCVAAAIAVASGVFWLRSGRQLVADSPATQPAPSSTAVAEVTSAEPRVASVDDSRADASSAPRATNDERLAILTGKMAEFSYEKLGSGYVDYLVERGLSRTDSERIIKQAMRDISACTLDTVRAQAAVQSVSFDVLLKIIEAGEFNFLYRPDGAALIDVDAVRERETLCTMNVRQQVGVPTLPLGLQIRLKPAG